MILNVLQCVAATPCKNFPRWSGLQNLLQPAHGHGHAASLRCKSSYYITTPIFYVNAEPHLGHLYSACLADARHRWEKLKQQESCFSTGTDEHGLKIQKAAAASGGPPSQFCDKISNKFKCLFDDFDVSYTDFIRTTDPRHKKNVHKFWETLSAGGFLYQGQYEGWYSVPDEAFLTQLQVEDKRLDGGEVVKVSKESGHRVEWMVEENYMFRLSQFSDQLRQWLSGDVIRPSVFRPLVDRWLEDLQDLSVSREAGRLQWGIPVPGDPSQTIYVWLDALINYLTVVGDQANSRWPPDCHVVGKDILKFHAVYWPAFLMAAGLPLPRTIFCHSHWKVDDVKMSKSLGNVVSPVDRMALYGTDGLRYFLLKEGVPHNDGNYNETKVKELLNADLCNTLGNLLSRCASSKINAEQTFPGHSGFRDNEERWMEKLYSLPGKVDAEFCDLHFYRGLDLIISRLHDTNAFLQHRRIWTLDSHERSAALHLAMENLRVCALLLQPVIPKLSATVLDRLRVPVDQRHFQDSLRGPSFELPRTLGEDSGKLYPRLR